MAVPLGDTTIVPKSYSDLTGTIPASAAPTTLQTSPPLGDNSTAIATTAWVKGQGYSGGGGVGAVNSVFTRVGDVIALTGDYTVSQITGAAPLASPVFTGTPTAPTPSLLDNSTKLATTAFVIGQTYAPLASPAFTGTPTAPTPSLVDNSTKLATTAWVVGQSYATGSPIQLNLLTTGGTPPSPFITTETPSGMNPGIFLQDKNGSWHPLAGIDTQTTSVSNSGPPAPDGTLTWTQRQFFRDTLAPTQAGKNAFLSINHLAGTTTACATNQDRALWMSIFNSTGTITSFSIDNANIVTIALTGVKPSFGFAKNQSVIPTGLSVGTYLNGIVFTVLSATIANTTQTITMSSASFVHSTVSTTIDSGSLDLAIYGLEGIQIEMDIVGSPLAQPAVDGELAVLSLQMSDQHLGTLPGFNDGQCCIRAQYYRQVGAGAWGSTSTACIRALVSNMSTVDAGGMILRGVDVLVTSAAGATNVGGVGVFINAPPTPSARLTYNWGLNIQDFGSTGNDRNIHSAGSMSAGTGINEFQGPVLLGTRTPASASDAGLTGTVTWDANFIYVCTATNTWKRAALSTW